MKKNTPIYLLVFINCVLFFLVLSNKPESPETSYVDNINVFNSKLLEFENELISLKKELYEISNLLNQINKISYDNVEITPSFEQSNLKDDVYINKILIVDQNFHARFSAKVRIYKYIIINRMGVPVIDKNRAWHVINKLNLTSMRKAAKKLVGTKDFSCFRSSSCRAKSPIKTMKLVKIKSTKDKIEIEFRSQSFLQQQVRSMVGCLKYVGEKKWTLKKFVNVMESKKRELCAPPAPSQGLYLMRVIY